MLDNFSNTQTVRKQVIATRGGVVAAQHRRAAEVGAAVLEAGGDAVDAAVATTFAIDVVEHWMSGPAAVGCMTLWRADAGRAEVVDYGMRAPRALDPADYPLTNDGRVADLFPWLAVVDDRNITGATAVAVPGVVAGMDLAHQRHGRQRPKRRTRLQRRIPIILRLLERHRQHLPTHEPARAHRAAPRRLRTL